jgi:hypothetical protein
MTYSSITVASKALARAVLPVLAGVLMLMAVSASIAAAAADKVETEQEFASDVTSAAGVLGAEVSTSTGGGYYFEYGTSKEALTKRIPVGQGSLLVGSSTVTQQLQGLEPGVVYYYRVVLLSEGETVEGPVNHFTTQPNTQPLNSAGFPLPDNRVWELVSPTEKYGARIEAISKEGAAIAAAQNGDAMTYVANSPTTSSPDGNPSLAYSQVMSVRNPDGGWSSRDLASPRVGEPTGLPHIGDLGEYYAFTPNLESGILEPIGAPPLAPNVKEDTVLIRENLLETAGAQYVGLTNEDDTPQGTVFGLSVEFVVSSNNLEHVILNSGSQLTAKPAGSGLYEWNKKDPDGELVPVSILPNGEFLNSSNAAVGDYSLNVRNAVSENGNRVFWESLKTGERSLYMREVSQGRTVQLDLPQGVEPPGGSPNALFQYATPSGEHVYFKDGQRLTADSTAEPQRPELYEYNTSTGILTDLTPNPKGQGHEGSDVRGEVIGVTDNGGYVYFVADGILSDENPVGESEEESNLYVIHIEGEMRTTSLVAVLAAEDEHDWARAKGATNERDLEGLTSRMSSNGQFLAFMSDLPLTNYDNYDVTEPRARDEEVFEYDAPKHSIACVSCNPTGARPHGIFDMEHSGEGIGLLVDRPELWENRWIAGSIPGWTARHLEQSDYQSRYLSNSGRLFFNASDGLVPQDNNGKEDVYEYEPDGVGGCQGGQATFGGCVSLISSGGSAHESAFLDASETGNDVFFLTAATLSGEDRDSSYDVYDAHVCSLEAPCSPVSLALSPACASNSSCQPDPSGYANSEESPSSSLGGVGNVPPVVRSNQLVTPPKGTHANALKNALKACARKTKRKRRTCEAVAHRRYGAGKATRAKRR